MTVHFQDEWLTVHLGDCREVMASMEPESVHCVVTSPPYWGLRDYGTATWVGGDEGCEHPAPARQPRNGRPLGSFHGGSDEGNASREPDSRRVCHLCGAQRQDSQLGLEATPEAYVEAMVGVFREVRRVLRDDGTVWLNLGDSYNGVGRGEKANGLQIAARATQQRTVSGLKEKDLVGIPWRVAFALQQPYYTGMIRSELDRVWLAAMIDAEGCLYIHRRQAGLSNGQGYVRKNDTHGAGLEISNTSEAIVKRCQEITGRGSISRQDKDRRQPLYRWSIRTNECREVIREIYPHLVAKQQQARIVLGCAASGEKAEAAFLALQGLHHGSGTTIDYPPPEPMWEPGWYLRSDVIWNKPNPMPESVTDRPTKSHEYLFLLSKSARYYFDAEAVRRPISPYNDGRVSVAPHDGNTGRVLSEGHRKNEWREYDEIKGANVRTVWTIATQPYPGAHFATFPSKLVEPCVKAGCPEGGVVLDPFAGSGTTGLVANRLGRRAALIDLSADYLGQVMVRNAQKPLGLEAS